MTIATTHLESIGHLCASLQAPYGRIRNEIDRLQIKPAVSINGIEHYSADDCERIADAIRNQESK